jgi:predicted ester cyclase
MDDRPADRAAELPGERRLPADRNGVVEAGDTLVIRGTFEVTHSGEFLGVPPTGRRVAFDWIDMDRVADERIVWRFLLCDWKGLLDQLTASA